MRGEGGWGCNEIGSLIADSESMLRDCENSNLGERNIKQNFHQLRGKC